MDNKNHEQYLEQVEIAVAETTMDLMKKHNGDLRAMANVCAEKQVEINRLKQYQTNDRKTIKQLRGHFQEAVDEIAELKDKDKMRVDEIDKAYDYSSLVQSDRDFWEQKSNNLKEERENASYELAGELEDINTRWAEDKEADRIVIDGLKEEKAGICGKYHADFCELEEKREEIVELKKEKAKYAKQPKGQEIEKVFGVSVEVFEKLMKEYPPNPDDYK